MAPPWVPQSFLPRGWQGLLAQGRWASWQAQAPSAPRCSSPGSGGADGSGVAGSIHSEGHRSCAVVFPHIGTSQAPGWACMCGSRFSLSCLSVWWGTVSAGRWSKRSPLSPQPPPLAQPAPLPPVLAPPSVGPLQPVPPHLPPYLAPTPQVVAPAQLKPLQIPPAPLQPLSQVPAQVTPTLPPPRLRPQSGWPLSVLWAASARGSVGQEHSLGREWPCPPTLGVLPRRVWVREGFGPGSGPEEPGRAQLRPLSVVDPPRLC